MTVKQKLKQILYSRKSVLWAAAHARRLVFSLSYRRQKAKCTRRAKREDLPLASDGQKILILAPHPDDEVLGCFFFVEQEASRQTIDIVYLSDGSACRTADFFKDIAIVRRGESAKAMAGLGIRRTMHGSHPDGKLGDFETDVELSVNNLLENSNYDIVVSPSPDDLTPDHAVVGRVALGICRRRKIALCYYRSTWATFGINDASAIYSGDVSLKRKAIAAFASQAHIPLMNQLLYSAIEAYRAEMQFRPIEAFIEAERYHRANYDYPLTNMLHWKSATTASLSMALDNPA